MPWTPTTAAIPPPRAPQSALSAGEICRWAMISRSLWPPGRCADRRTGGRAVTLRYSAEERRQFAAAMGRVPALRDRAGRDLAIARLEAAIGQPLDLVRESDGERDVANLADLCLRHPEFVQPLLDVLSAA